MRQITMVLVSVIFMVCFGSTMQKSYSEPLGEKKYTETTAAPVTDKEDVPDRLKTARTVGRGGAQSDSSKSKSVSANGDQNGDSSDHGSGSLTDESPTSRGHKLPSKGVSSDSPTPVSGQQGSTLLDKSPKSKGNQKSSEGSNSDSDDTNSGDGFSTVNGGLRKPPSRKAGNNLGIGSSSSGPVPNTCDGRYADRHHFGPGMKVVQISSGDPACGLKRYVINTTVKANWFQALGLCSASNMSLASVENDEEQDALSLLLDGTGVPNAWLSGNDLGQTNKYVWINTGQPIIWTNWNVGEPNHEIVGNKTEHCLEVIGSNWLWNDNLCDTQENFVCQYYHYN